MDLLNDDEGPEGTAVAGGKHIVPNFVAIEELDGGKKKLAAECPDALAALLEKKNLRSVYDCLVKAVVEESSTRDIFFRWKDQEFNSIINLFRDDFAAGGIKVALCKRKSASGTHRWLEFIDMDAAPKEGYVPQFDTANLSGQVIKTIYSKLEFPNGVAVEQLENWRGRKKLKEKIPVYVEKILQKKDLMSEYNEMVDDCVAKGFHTNLKCWMSSEIQNVIDEHRPKFQPKGVDLFLCQKEEYVSHGQYGGHMERFRWIEFVDRALQPNYTPQRDHGAQN